MPFLKCPECGSIFHLLVLDTAKWIEERWPNYSLDELLPELCLNCWKNIKQHDWVQVISTSRKLQGVKVGDIGTILSINDSGNFKVECVLNDGSSKWIHILKKKEIAKLSPESPLIKKNQKIP